MFHEKVERLAEQIRDEDRIRLLEPTSLPKVLRGYQRRPRPATAIISIAAQCAYQRRLAQTAEDRETGEILRRHLSSRERMLNRIARKLRFRSA